MAPLTQEEAYGVFTDVDGTSVRLDGRACEAVRATLRLIEGGKPQDGDASSDPLISTGTVAELLGVSRRTVTRILDAGDIPCERQGRGHRRVRMSHVLRYKAESERQEALLEEMRRNMYEGGLDDLDMIESYLSQFDEGAEEA